MDRWVDGGMDGWTDRWMDGQMDGWMNGRTDGQTDGQTDGWPGGLLCYILMARIGRITGRLPLEFANEIVGSLLDLFRYNYL